MKRLALGIGILFLSVLLAACGAAPAPTPVPRTPTPVRTDTATFSPTPTATWTLTPTSTETPTATRLPPCSVDAFQAHQRLLCAPAEVTDGKVRSEWLSWCLGNHGYALTASAPEDLPVVTALLPDGQCTYQAIQVAGVELPYVGGVLFVPFDLGGGAIVAGTATPTPTPAPTRTATPVPTPLTGTMYYDWLRPRGLAVYAGNVVLCQNDYLCPDEKVGLNPSGSFELGRWNPDNRNSQFVYVGQASVEQGKLHDVTLMFPPGRTYEDVVVLCNNLAVDFIAGILHDGREVPFNYAYNAEGVLVPASNFIEGWGSGHELHAVFDQSWNMKELERCGIAGIAPDGSYNLVSGGIIFKLPTVTYSALRSDPNLWGPRGQDAYALTGIRVVYRSAGSVSGKDFCPPR